MKTDVFQSCGHCWVFQICWHIECSNFTASSFRIWNSSTEIPSPPLALFIVMLPKAHLTSHTRMSGSRWVIKPSWLSGLWRSFLYSSSVYSCHLFLISSASVRSLPFLSFIEPIFTWNVPLVSLIFLKRSLFFPFCCFLLFLCTDRQGRLSYLSLLFLGTLHSDASVQFSSVQSLSRVWLFATPWITACQASLSITNSWSSLRLTSIESVMPSSHLILRHPLLLLPPIPPSFRVCANESTLRMRWPKYWSFQHLVHTKCSWMYYRNKTNATWIQQMY